ncbi:MAG: endo-1,4-beta-xylanase [Planctomycetes bacterium]|nr:endo-1,4-beta-xylanase [Planctomycetota bacterium]
MHRFVCCPTGDHNPLNDLQGAHMIGSDGVPMRGEVRLVDSEIQCETRSQEPVGLSLLWPVQGFGTVQLETTRLPPRDKPYNLHIELARHRLMRLTLKREEWGLFDYPGFEEIVAQINQARELFIQAQEHSEDLEAAARLADESLSLSMHASERTCQFHAAVFLSRRQQSGGFSHNFMGVSVLNETPLPSLTRHAHKAFDFVRIPTVWRAIQPTEQAQNFASIDAWVKACTTAKIPLRGGPLLNFGVRFVPDWMYIWENDFETIFELAREHIRRIVQRYAGQVSTWIVASGLHADNAFALNFEQIMELTRMAASITKHLAPNSQTILELTQPWGEYYARNQRTVPPLLYADMLTQSGVNFDALGLQFLFGIGSDGYHLRDLFQISVLIDRLANLNKPLHITAVGVPSESSAGVGGNGACDGGQWHTPWSDETQAEWIGALGRIALSKPYVESVCMHALVDGRCDAIPSAGLLREDLTPKPAYRRLAELRRSLQPRAAR